MRKFIFIIIALVAIVNFLSCATSDKKLSKPEGILLSQSELEQLFSKGISFVRRSPTTQRNARVDTRPDGTQSMNWLDRDGKRIGKLMLGTYTIKNGQKCDNFTGQEKCWKIYKISEERYYFETNDSSEFGYLSRF